MLRVSSARTFPNTLGHYRTFYSFYALPNNVAYIDNGTRAAATRSRGRGSYLADDIPQLDA